MERSRARRRRRFDSSSPARRQVRGRCARAIKGEVERLAVLGGIVVVLLWLAFASLRALAVALLPVATGVLAGIAAVSLGFGQVHGLTLGFGTTLIGEAVDYAIYYLIQARGAAAARAGNAGAVSWPTVRLGLFTSADRLRGARLLRLSRARPARRVLARGARRRSGDDPVRLPGARAGRRARRRACGASSARFIATPRAAAAPAICVRWLAVGALAALLVGPAPWRAELSALSPVPRPTHALDAETARRHRRHRCRNADRGRGADDQATLASAEAPGARLEALVTRATSLGYDSRHRCCQPRRAGAPARALPDAETLRARLAEAPRRARCRQRALDPFIADVRRPASRRRSRVPR